MLKGTLSIAGIALLIVSSIMIVHRDTEDTETGHDKVSGAYRALNFWGDSRAYPESDIPSDAYALAYDYSTNELRKPLLSIKKTLGLSESVESMAALFSISPRRLSSGWHPIGPTNGGGRTLALAFDPSNPDIMYAGSASGGLWKTFTGGVGAEAWSRINTGFPVLGVSCITFEPGNSDVIYIGTGEVYNVFVSGDLEADRRTRGSYGIGILKTTDGGLTWSKSLDWTYNQRDGVWAIRVDPFDFNVIWAATTNGVYKSTDGGTSWTHKLAVPMANDLVVHPVNTDTVIVGAGNLSSAARGIYRTTDGGSSWAKITSGGIPANFAGKIQFGVTPADADVVYASIGNGYDWQYQNDNFTWLFRSDNFGASFTLQSTTDYSRWQGWYAQDVAVSPVDPDEIICIGIDIWKSTDAGVTLTQRSSWQDGYSGNIPDGGPEGLPSYSHADHHDVIYHPTDPNIFYVANDGGVFRSVNGGSTFQGVNGGYQTQQFYNGSYCSPTDPDLAMGGLQDNSSVIYRGNGMWARGILGGDGGWCAIHPLNPDILYATAQFLYVGRSTNGGSSFSLISPPDGGGPVAFIAPFVMSPTTPTKLFGGSNYFFVSFDSGGLWYAGQQATPIDGNPILLIAVAEQNDDVVYIATAPVVDRGRVHRTLNGGSTFTDLTGSLPDRYPADLAVDPTDEATVYLALSGFGSSHVFKSTDYGDHWIDIDGGRLPDLPVTAVVVDPLYPQHVYVGNDLGVYFSPNEGATWIQLHRGLPEAVLMHELNICADRKLRAFTHGVGVYERNLVGS